MKKQKRSISQMSFIGHCEEILRTVNLVNFINSETYILSYKNIKI